MAEPRIESLGRLPPHLYSDDHDARRFAVEGVVYFALIQGLALLALHGLVPRWTLPLVLPVLLARMMIGRHELIHLRKESEADWFNRFWPVLAMVTPFSAGYREYRRQHALHHAHLLTDRDADWYQLRGSFLAGVFHIFTSPEQDPVRWARKYGLDRRLVVEMLVRATFFGATVWLYGPIFFWYWVPLRLTYGAALFLFSYGLHRRGAKMGTYRIELSPVQAWLFSLVMGRTGWLAVCNHDLHHANAKLAADRFLEVRDTVAARDYSSAAVVSARSA